jgi:hypothetical protein
MRIIINCTGGGSHSMVCSSEFGSVPAQQEVTLGSTCHVLQQGLLRRCCHMQMLLDSTTVQDLKQYIEKKEGDVSKHA